MEIFGLVSLDPHRIRKLNEKPVVLKTTTYLSEQGLFYLVELNGHWKGGLDWLGFLNLMFSYSFFGEKCFSVSFELVKQNLLARLEEIIRTPMVELKTKTRYALICIDSLLRVVLEELIHLLLEKLFTNVREQCSN